MRGSPLQNSPTNFDIYAFQNVVCHPNPDFWNHHRNESRGIGGLFFDYLRPNFDHKIEDLYEFVSDVGNSFLEAYLPIVNKRKNQKFNSDQKKWQEIRRGRYVVIPKI